MRRIAPALLGAALLTQAAGAETYVFRHPIKDQATDPVTAACGVTVRQILDGAAPQGFKDASKAVRDQAEACAEARRQAAEGGGAPATGDVSASLTGLPQGPSILGDRIEARVAVANPSGAVSYAVVAGALPEGVVLSPDGALTGQLLAVGPFSATLAATDGMGRQAKVTYSGEVLSLAPDIALAVPAGPLFPGDAFRASASVVNGTGPLRWSLVGSPAWLGVDPGTGAVGGTLPDGVSGFSFLLRVTDARGRTDEAASGDIAIVTPRAVVDLPPSVVQGGRVTGRLTTNLPDPTWTKVTPSGTAPPLPGWWLAVSPDGTVTGTAPDSDADQRYAFQAEASSGGHRATARAVVDVVLATVTVRGFPSSALKGDAIAAQATTNLGGDVSWSLANAPDWLSIDAGGALSGTATGPANGVVVKAARGMAKVESLPFSMALATPEVNVSGFPPAVRSGATATGRLTTTVIDGAWGATSVPPGFGLAVSGDVVTGVAPQAGATGDYALTLTRTGRFGASASVTLPVTVVPPLAVAPMPGLVGGLTGDPVSIRPVVLGGIGALTFSLRKGEPGYGVDAEGDLAACAGLTFSRLTGAIQGIPTKECAVAGVSVEVADDGGSRPTAAATARSVGFDIRVEAPAVGTAPGERAFVEGSGVAIPMRTNLRDPVWSLAGDAPAWLGIGPDGVVSGTVPEVDADRTVLVPVIAQGGGRRASLTLDVSLRAGAVTVDAPSGATFDGQPFAATASTTLPRGSRFSLSGNPGWLLVDAATGTLSGTASAAFPAKAVTVTATAPNGAHAVSAPFSVPLAVPAVTVVGSPFVAYPGRPVRLTASSNLAQPAWSLVGAPDWLAVGADGIIGGVPPLTAGSASLSFRVRAERAPLSALSGVLSGVVETPSLSVNPMRSLEMYVKVPWRQAAPLVYGAVGPLAWRVASGHLPDGLSLGDDGTVSGTPPVEGVWTFSLGVTDLRTGLSAQTNPYTYQVVLGTDPGIGFLPMMPDIDLDLDQRFAIQPQTPPDAVAPLTWEWFPKGAGTVDPSAGTLTGKAPSNATRGSYTVRLADATGRKWASNPFWVTVGPKGSAFLYDDARGYGGDALTLAPLFTGAGLSGVTYAEMPITPGLPCSLSLATRGLALDAATGIVTGTVAIPPSDLDSTFCRGVTATNKATGLSYYSYVNLRIYARIASTSYGDLAALTDRDAGTVVSLPPGQDMVLTLARDYPVRFMTAYTDDNMHGRATLQHSLDGRTWTAATSMGGSDRYLFRTLEAVTTARFVRIRNTGTVPLAVNQVDIH